MLLNINHSITHQYYIDLRLYSYTCQAYIYGGVLISKKKIADICLWENIEDDNYDIGYQYLNYFLE